jgi:RNA polymerase sigma-70 factor (ECF subfamily)
VSRYGAIREKRAREGVSPVYPVVMSIPRPAVKIPVGPGVEEDEPDRVLRAIAGDTDAFASLYDAYARPMFLFLRARLPSREDAEDALQAVFLSAWSALPRLRDPGRFAGWLFRIARNSARDVVRRRTLRPVLLRDDDEPVATPDEEDDEAERVRTLLERLRPETRSIVLLRAVEGWSTREVARALGRGESTVRRRYAAALRHLEESLAPGARR